MNTKTSNKDYIGDPLLKKDGLDNKDGNFVLFRLWAEKGGGGSACEIVSAEKVTVVFKEDPLSVRTNRIDFFSSYSVYSASNYPDAGCVLSGSELGISLGISYDGVISDEEISRQTKILGGPFFDSQGNYPGDITQFVTQPNDENYTGFIYVTIDIPAGFSSVSSFSGEFSNYQYEVVR